MICAQDDAFTVFAAMAPTEAARPAVDNSVDGLTLAAAAAAAAAAPIWQACDDALTFLQHNLGANTFDNNKLIHDSRPSDHSKKTIV